MTQLDLLLPFALPPAEMAKDLLKAIHAPAFATLISRARLTASEHGHEFSRALPHERWLASQFGVAPVNEESSPAVAASAMREYGIHADEGTWFLLHPIHIHIARDHLVLTDIRRLAITEHESRALFDIAQPLFEENGRKLAYGDARTWFLRADEWSDLHTSTPDAACGHNVDIWMPKGPGERDWRRLQNEVQMHWHDHAINEEREARGLVPVNSLWLWGGSHASQLSRGEYGKTCGSQGWMQALIAGKGECSAADMIAATAPRALAVLNDLTESALAGDLGSWLACFNALEAAWFEPLIAALRARTLDRIDLICTNDGALSTFAVTRASLRKFWIKPSLSRLLP